MLSHIVLFKAPVLTKDEELRLQRQVAECGRIAGVLSAAAGPIVNEDSGGYTHGLVIVFDKPESLERYRHDPLHRAFADWIVPRSEFMRVDVSSEAVD